jgi:peroxiredoxin Q/BCP
VILGVSFDTPAENRAFAEKCEFPFLLLSDPDHEIGLAYHAAHDRDQAFADRITYLIDPEGKIAKAYARVDVQSHPAEVLADI